MISNFLRRIGKGQKGFTIVEAIATLAITGIIALGAAAATTQVVTHGGRNADYNTASQYTMNAIYWVSRDAQMSQTLDPSGVSGFPLTLGWTEWDNSEHEVVYTIEGDRLVRSLTIINGGERGEPKEMLVALCINSSAEETNCDYSDGVLSLKVTATVGEGGNALSVTKVREVAPRPGL